MKFINNKNLKLINHLLLIATMYKLLKDIYRNKVYYEAAINLYKLSPKILLKNYTSLLKGIKGIGPSITATVKEFLETGTSERLQEISNKSKPAKALELFTTIYGIGPVKAEKLYQAGYRTIDDLKKLARQDHLDRSDELTHAQKGYILYYEDLQNKIPRSEMNKINKYLTTLFKDYKWQMVGSYRRGLSESSDIDILISSTKLLPPGQMDIFNLRGKVTIAEVVKRLGKSLIYDLAEGPTKYMGIAKFPVSGHGPGPGRIGGEAHRIDIRIVEEHEWPFALLYFTGPKSFNIRIRNLAKDLGYQKLSEYGLYVSDYDLIGVDDEEEIFNLLQLDYKDPEDRF